MARNNKMKGVKHQLVNGETYAIAFTSKQEETSKIAKVNSKKFVLIGGMKIYYDLNDTDLIKNNRVTPEEKQKYFDEKKKMHDFVFKDNHEFLNNVIKFLYLAKQKEFKKVESIKISQQDIDMVISELKRLRLDSNDLIIEDKDDSSISERIATEKIVINNLSGMEIFKPLK